MKKLALFLFMGILLISCNQTSPKNPQEQESAILTAAEPLKDGVFIHISEGYNDPHRVLMPLKMATMMAADKNVIVYMDIHAVDLLVKSSKDLNYADFESAHTYIKQLTDKNIGVYACPTCLKIAGFKPEDLLDGVQVAEKEKFFNFTEGRIITLDY
jgi:predicted peroxiredoxin